jgi:16S rRNA (uracil1498-N3)-methyltransferase
LEKVITSAMKQSVKAYHPVFHPMINFEKFLGSEFSGIRLIAHCMEDGRQELIKMKPANSDFTILIGPEGDFSEAEVKSAISKGFIPVSFGASRLRTETAGIVACQMISDIVALS